MWGGIATKFQFHNGTIKRKAKKINAGILCLFQFHNGTIKRLYGIETNQARHNGFNSIMVRLKGVTDRQNIPTQPRFQFHNGTIKSTKPPFEIQTC